MCLRETVGKFLACYQVRLLLYPTHFVQQFLFSTEKHIRNSKIKTHSWLELAHDPVTYLLVSFCVVQRVFLAS